MTASMAKEPTRGRTAANTSANGPTANSMAKVFTGTLAVKNAVVVGKRANVWHG